MITIKTQSPYLRSTSLLPKTMRLIISHNISDERMIMITTNKTLIIQLKNRMMFIYNLKIKLLHDIIHTQVGNLVKELRTVTGRLTVGCRTLTAHIYLTVA